MNLVGEELRRYKLQQCFIEALLQSNTNEIVKEYYPRFQYLVALICFSRKRIFQTLLSFGALLLLRHWDMTKNNLFLVYISWALLPTFVSVTTWILLVFSCLLFLQSARRWIVFTVGKQEHKNIRYFIQILFQDYICSSKFSFLFPWHPLNTNISWLLVGVS